MWFLAASVKLLLTYPEEEWIPEIPLPHTLPDVLKQEPILLHPELEVWGEVEEKQG